MKSKLLLLVAALFTINAFAQVPTSGLIGWWPFTGNANDLSGNNNNGTVYGATLTNDRFGNANSAYQFNGTSSYIKMLNGGPQGNASRTVSFWAKTSSTGEMVPFDYGSTTTSGNEYQIQFNNGCSGIGMDVYNGVVTRGSNSFLDNSWHHFAIVLDNTIGSQIDDVLYYVDGVIVPNINCAPANQNQVINTVTVEPIHIGKVASSSNVRFFNGTLDDYYFYDRALTQEEITGIFNDNCTTADITTGLVASYPFTGNADDVSGNNLDGTVTGATLTTDRFGNVNSAYNFNGTSDYITVADNNLLDFTNQFSFSLWVNIQDYTLGSSIYPRNMISKPRLAMTTGYAIRSVDITPIPLQYSGGLNDNISNVIFGSSDTLDLNVWEHVMLTYNGSTLKIYKNGQLKSSQSASLNFPNSTQPLFIGKEFNTSNNDARWFKGLLDDIRVYNNALTDCDIDSLYNLGNPCDGVTASITPSGTTTFCQGGSVVLNASAGASYLWSPGGATSQSITVTSGNTYTVTVIDGNGCSATSTGTTVTVNPNPTVTLSSISALCSNAQAVTLTGGSPSGGSYTLDGNSATSIQPWLLSAGSHPVVYSYTDGNGCIGTATQSVTINAAPTVTLSGLGTNYLITDGPVQLTGTPSGGIFTGAGVQGNMFDPSLAGLGTHSVIYMYSNGCMNADGLCTTVDLQIGIEGEDMNGNDGSFSVTPNPNSGSFSVNLNSVNPLGFTTLEIYNALGQLIQSEQINNQSNTLKKQIELNVAKGMYTVRLTTNGNVYSEKLIIK